MQEDFDEQSDALQAIGFAGALVFVAAGVAIAVGAGLLDDANDALVTAALVSEANDRKAMRPTEACIRQYGPGERWNPPTRSPSLDCASPAGAVPNDVLIVPVKQ